MTIVHLRAPAKLTTSLHVTGVRADGLHLIDATMVTIDLYDELTVDPRGDGVHYTGRGDAATPILGDPTDDLISKALRLAGASARVEVTKNIPAGAGLGGGSADAAAVLRWAGYRDMAGAAAIGADIAFCLVGGHANVRGIGELIEQLPFAPRTFTLVTPDVHCSTAEVYTMWDDLGGPSGSAGNDLEPAALAVAPELAAVRDQLGDATGRAPQLAGSGSSWFVDGAYPHAGRVVHALPPENST